MGTDGEIIGKYRKIHLPGHADKRDGIPFQHLEKRYFEVGNLGFGTLELVWGWRYATIDVGRKRIE